VSTPVHPVATSLSRCHGTIAGPRVRKVRTVKRCLLYLDGLEQYMQSRISWQILNEKPRFPVYRRYPRVTDRHTDGRTENVDHCYSCGRPNLSSISRKFCSSPVLLKFPCCSPDLRDTCPRQLHSGPVSTISSLQRKPPRMAKPRTSGRKSDGKF